MNKEILTQQRIFSIIDANGIFVYSPIYWRKENDDIMEELVDSGQIKSSSSKAEFNGEYIFRRTNGSQT